MAPDNSNRDQQESNIGKALGGQMADRAGDDLADTPLGSTTMHVDKKSSRLGFQIHALVFVLTMVLLVAINLWTGAPYWVLWVLLGWGLGLIAHWWFVLGPGAGSASNT